jgi:hypothetical protein
MEFQSFSPHNKELEIKLKKKGIAVTYIAVDDVQIALTQDDEVIYEDIKTLEDVVHLDKAKPNLVAYFVPPLHKSFLDAKGEHINPFVKKGDKVKVAPEFASAKDTELGIQIVKRVYFKSLNNMTIIMVTTEEQGMYIAYQLIKV